MMRYGHSVFLSVVINMNIWAFPLLHQHVCGFQPGSKLANSCNHARSRRRQTRNKSLLATVASLICNWDRGRRFPSLRCLQQTAAECNGRKDQRWTWIARQFFFVLDSKLFPISCCWAFLLSLSPSTSLQYLLSSWIHNQLIWFSTEFNV